MIGVEVESGEQLDIFDPSLTRTFEERLNQIICSVLNRNIRINFTPHIIDPNDFVLRRGINLTDEHGLTRRLKARCIDFDILNGGDMKVEILYTFSEEVIFEIREKEIGYEAALHERKIRNGFYSKLDERRWQ